MAFFKNTLYLGIFFFCNGIFNIKTMLISEMAYFSL